MTFTFSLQKYDYMKRFKFLSKGKGLPQQAEVPKGFRVG